MSKNVPLLELKGVVKEYPSFPVPLRVLDGVDFSLNAGESAAVVGPSGCGKSTLLNLMGMLDRPDAGIVRVRGTDAALLDSAALARLRNRDLGFVFQLHHLLPQCTVLENVLIPTLPHPKEQREEAVRRAEMLLERMGLAGRRHHRPGELSGGECQRAAVARALINQPSLLLADEPTGALNEEAALSLAELLLELRNDLGMSIVIVTHASSIAQRFGRVFQLDHGRLTGEA
jgi:lipoprotein-releasing system ATP-binding protein